MKTLYNLWLSLLNKLHLYTFGQHNKVCETAATAYEIQIKALTNANNAQSTSIATLEQQVEKLKQEVAKLTAERDELASAIDPVTAERNSLREQIVAYKDAAMENLPYVKNVEKQLSKVLQSSDAFGFPHATGIPGSTSISSGYVTYHDRPTAFMQGRTILTDDLTQKINDIPDQGSRIQLVMDFMDKYGVFKKIGRDFFMQGAAKCVLGYSEKCTNYELYYEIVAEQVNDESILVVRNPNEKDSDVEK